MSNDRRIKHTVYSCAPLDSNHCAICEREDALNNLVPASGRIGNERVRLFLHAACFERELQKDA
jgi:hypothetical protein